MLCYRKLLQLYAFVSFICFGVLVSRPPMELEVSLIFCFFLQFGWVILCHWKLLQCLTSCFYLSFVFSFQYWNLFLDRLRIRLYLWRRQQILSTFFCFLWFPFEVSSLYLNKIPPNSLAFLIIGKLPWLVRKSNHGGLVGFFTHWVLLQHGCQWLQ